GGHHGGAARGDRPRAGPGRHGLRADAPGRARDRCAGGCAPGRLRHRPDRAAGAAAGGAMSTPEQPREIRQRGLYYEELETGVVYRHAPGRTLTESDNVFFSALSMNPQSLHLDAAWSATQPFGRPLVDRKSTRLNSSHVSISYA